MAHEVQVDELLSAYLRNDTTPEERVAIERRLAEDPKLKALSAELSELLTLLKQGERPVTDTMVATLRERINKQVAQVTDEVTVRALVAASLTGDVNSREKELVEQYLAKHPSGRAELASLKNFNAVLSKGEFKPKSDLSARLAERMRAKLPEAMTRTAKVDDAVPASAPRTTVRFYVAETSPWKSRLAWGAAAAIALALGTGAALQLFGNKQDNIAKQGGNDPQPAPEIAKKDNGPDGSQKNVLPEQEIVVDLNPPKLPAPLPENVTPAPKNVATNNQNPNVQAPEQLAPRGTVPDKKVVEHQPRLTPAPMHQNDPVEPKEPKAPEERVTQNETPPGVNEPAPNPQQPAPPPRLDPKDNNGIAFNPGTGVINPALNPDTVQNPLAAPGVDPLATNEPDPALSADGVAVVGAVLGNVQARNPATGKTESVRQGDKLPTSSEVFTGEGQIALVMPDNGKLWVNRNSGLTFTLKGKAASVQLNSGEIAYRGNAAITVNSGNRISEGKAINVKVQDNRITLSAMEGTAKVTGTKTPLPVPKGMQGIASLNTEELPAKAAAYVGQPDAWRMDLEKAVTSEENDKNEKEKISRTYSAQKQKKK